MELVFARFIRKVGDLLPVGRPGRIALHDSRSVREVAEVALFFRNRYDLPPGFKNGPGGGGRKAGRGKAVTDIHELVADFEHISGDGDG